jgi:MtN3 and saliva related transmembrane protein
MDAAVIVGAIASFCSVTSFTPQAWKIIKSRRTDDISKRMFILTVTGFAFWTAYGVLLGAWPIIITNAICFVLAGFILTMKLLPQRRKDKVADVLDPQAH